MTPTRIRVCDVIAAAGDVIGVTYADITSRKRAQPIVRARMLAIFVAAELTDKCERFIATKVGIRDPGYVNEARARVRALTGADPELERDLERVRAMAARLALEWHARCSLNANHYLEMKYAA